MDDVEQSSYPVEILAIPESMTATWHAARPSSASASAATSISIHTDLLVMKGSPNT